MDCLNEISLTEYVILKESITFLQEQIDRLQEQKSKCEERLSVVMQENKHNESKQV